MTETSRFVRAGLAVQAYEWPAKLGLALGFAGVTALLAQLAIPLPWTPVPLTFQLLGVYLTSTMLGPRYGWVSMAIYVAAGAFGLHVFAPSSDAFNPDALWSGERWRILVPDAVARTGFTAGYLVGFVAAAAFVGNYLRKRASGGGARFVTASSYVLALFLIAVAAGAFFLAQGNTFRDADSGNAYGSSADAIWLLSGLFFVVAPVGLWVARRRGGEGLRLYVVLMGATALIHACGVFVLKWTLDMPWTLAFALGSAVFLPFDALKAAIAVLVTKPFLPTAPHGESA